jgi:plasmid replication initiation protein
MGKYNKYFRAMTLAIDNPKEVKKHVAAIHIAGKLSLLQRKFYNVLLYNSYDELLKKEKHQILVSQLCSLAGFDSRNHGLIKETIVSLSKTSVTWNLLDDDDVEEWGVSTMLSEAVIRNGMCTYAYSPTLREKLYKPELYARINLKIQSKFSGTHAFALYENAIRFRSVGTTGWKDLEFWRSVLGIQKGEYKLFKDFNKRVIKPAVQEVNETSDILLVVEYRREKKRVTAMKFSVEDNPQMPIPFPIKDQLLRNIHEESDEERAITADEESSQFRRLLSFGVPKGQAQKTIAEHEEAYIDANLDIVERNFAAGKVDNLPAYTVAALERDYRPKISPYETDQVKKKNDRRRAIIEQAQRKEQEEKEKNEREAADLKRRIESMSGNEREAFEARFQEEYRRHPLFLKWKEAGMDNPVMKGMFLSFAYRELMSRDDGLGRKGVEILAKAA